MTDVPSNLIPTRISQLPTAPVASEDGWLYFVYQGNSYKIRAGDLLSVVGVPTSRQVNAGTGLTGGGTLASNVTLSVAVGGIGSTQLDTTGVAAGVYGSATEVPVMTVDANGRVVSVTNVPVTVSGYVPVTRQVIAGTGLAGGGALNANVTLDAALSDSTPLSGTTLGSAGVSTEMSRTDHQHPSVDLADNTEVQGLLGLSHGGTAKSLVPDAGAIIWCGSDGLYVGPVGVAGQILQSAGAGEYVWVDQDTIDAATAADIRGGAANKIVYQSGTNTTAFIDAPSVSQTLLKWNGTGFEWGTVSGVGTVTSVGLSLPTEFSVTNSPVTGSGTLTGAWNTQTTNKIFASPNGSTGSPSFRALVNADLPASGVTANTYGSTTAIPVITVNAQGIVTNVTTAGIVGGLSYQGSWNALTNSPALASGVGTNGYYYVVSVAGTTNLDGITDWQVGDWAIFNGTAWQKIDQTNLVSSVNGYTGAVVLSYSDVGAPSTSGTNATGTWNIGISGNAATATSATSAGSATTAGSVTNAVTFTNTGGDVAGTTFNGSAAKTIDYSTVGAPKADGTGASGTWGISISGTAASATNVAGGAANKIVYNTGSGVTAFIDAPVTTGHYLKWNGSAFTWDVAGTGTVTSITAGSYLTGGTITTSGTIAVDATSLNTASKVVARDASGDFSAGIITASLSGNATTATSATTSTNLAGGAASQIPYQTGAGATAFLANGTAGQVLTSTGATAPAWGGINGGTF